MNYQHILYEVSDKIATITLNRPDRMNAWTATMERDVRDAMKAAADDDNVRVIVLTGAGRAFCAGADMEALQGIDPNEIIDTVNKAMNAVLSDPKSQARFAELGASLLPGSASDFGKLLADETDKWGKVVKFSGAKID